MRTTKKCILLALLSVLVFAVRPGDVLGQATASGTVQGTVTDPSQAVISGANVVITNSATGEKRTMVTDSSGYFRFDLLSAGSYAVSVSNAGFSTVVQKIELLVGGTTSANVTLKPGAATQTVEVIGENPLVDVLKTSVSDVITPTEVQSLPMVGQDAANLAYLAPGVKFSGSYDPTKNRYAILSVNGDSGRNVNVTVNGIDNKDNTVGGTVMQLPLEAVEEYHISTQRFSAENGRSEGAAINMITKRGGNQLHGSAFGYFRDTTLQTDEKQADGLGGQVKAHPDYSRQQFGGSAGGPLKKDKAFLFFAIQRERESQSLQEAINSYTQLTAAKPFFSGDNPAATIPRPFYENRYNGRADYTFNDKESAYISYTSQANNSLNDQSDGTGDLNNGNFTVNHLQLANFTVNSIFTNTTVNQFTFGFSYWNNLIASNISAPLVTFPSASFGTNTNVPQQSFQRKWQFKDDFSKVVGKHSFKTGVDYIWNPVEGGFFESNSTLEIDFAADPTAIIGNTGGKYPQGFATPGAVTGMSNSNGNPYFLVPTKQLGLYAQDDWKTTRRLNLSLGVRWDKDFNTLGQSLIPKSRTYLELVALNQPLSNAYVKSLPHNDNLDFSPRIGFAYDVTGRGNHVVRGGFGLYFGNSFQNIPLFMEQQANATVFAQVLSLSSTTDVVPGSGKTLGTWRYGIDAMPTIPAPSTQLAAGSVGRLIDPHYRNPVTEEFNGGYTWAVNQGTAVELEYTHVLGLHINRTMNIDQKIPINGVLTRPLDPAFAANPSIPELASVRNEESIGREHYDGFNFSFRERAGQRFTAEANYTLSWAYGFDTGAAGGSFRNYARLSLNPFAPYEWGPSSNDERHHITVSSVINLPKGFETGPILQYGSARPYNLVNSTNTLNTGGGTTNAVVVPTSSPTAYQTYLGSSGAIAAQNCFYGINGAAQGCTIANYDPLRGQPYFELDMRLAKSFRFGERMNLQIIAQAFNLTNRANYGNDYGSSTLGIETSNIAAGAAFNHPQGFIAPVNTTIPRSLWGEFGTRFSF